MKLLKSPMFLLSIIVVLMIAGGYMLKKQTYEEKMANVGKKKETKFIYYPYDLLSAVYVRPDKFYAVGGNGVILRSNDRGKTWSTMSLNLWGDNLTSIFLVDDKRGWVVGTNGFAFYTLDGGDSWHRIDLGVGEVYLKRVYFFNSNIGWIVGEGPTLLYTKDGGNRWERRSAGLEYETINDIGFFTKKEGLLIGEAGVLCRTMDGGKTWERIKGITSSTLTRALIIDDHRAAVVGLEGTLLFTDDRGNTWKKLTVFRSDVDVISKAPLFALAWLPAVGSPHDTLYVGGKHVLACTFDLGRSWRWKDNIAKDIRSVAYRELYSFAFIDSTYGIAVGKNGIIYLTDDATKWMRVH